MSLDRSFVERNRASTNRMRTLAGRLSDAELQTPLGQHWTVAIALLHLAFWERRTLALLDETEKAGKLVAATIDISVNDLSLPFWAAVPPREAARLAIESAQAVDEKLESYPPALVELVYAGSERWVQRDLHRDEHLDEVEAVLKS
jgi:hypothetical protein